MGALLLTAGTKGKRYSLPHSRILLHQPMGGFSGQASDIDIHAREIMRLKQDLNLILQHHTGQKLDRLQQDTDRDFFMSGEQALEYGVIDKVISKRQTAGEN
jgi:ATP-dependent Clp protease protease subunit